jgi:hypothetical protein
MTAVFETYRFDNLHTDESRILDGQSYLLAAIFGPLYVLFRGFIGLAILMLIASTVLAAIAAAGVIASVSLFEGDAVISLGAAAAFPIAFLMAQAVVAIQLMRVGYIRRGWREGY